MDWEATLGSLLDSSIDGVSQKFMSQLVMQWDVTESYQHLRFLPNEFQRFCSTSNRQLQGSGLEFCEWSMPMPISKAPVFSPAALDPLFFVKILLCRFDGGHPQENNNNVPSDLLQAKLRTGHGGQIHHSERRG